MNHSHIRLADADVYSLRERERSTRPQVYEMIRWLILASGAKGDSVEQLGVSVEVLLEESWFSKRFHFLYSQSVFGWFK